MYLDSTIKRLEKRIAAIHADIRRLPLLIEQLTEARVRQNRCSNNKRAFLARYETSAPQQNISKVCVQHHDLSSKAQL